MGEGHLKDRKMIDQVAAGTASLCRSLADDR